MDISELTRIALVLDDPGDVLTLIKTAKVFLKLRKHKLLWKRLIAKHFKALFFLYDYFVLSELDWFLEFNLLFTISCLIRRHGLEFGVNSNLGCFIHSSRMYRNLKLHYCELRQKWHHTVREWEDDVERLDTILAFNPKNLAYGLNLIHGNDNDRKRLYACQINSDFIPSHLLLYRLLSIFNCASTPIIARNKFTWYLQFFHTPTKTLILFKDDKGLVSLFFSKNKHKDQHFVSDLSELLNTLSIPFHPEPASRCAGVAIPLRERMRYIYTLFQRAIPTSGSFANKPSECLITKRKEFKESLRDLERTLSAACQKTESEKICVPNLSPDSSYNLNLQKDICLRWFVTTRRIHDRRRVIYNKESCDWFVTLNEFESEQDGLSLSSLTRQKLETCEHEAISSSVGLYRLFCIFPSAFYSLDSSETYFWFIVLSHSQTARLLEFRDRDGLMEVAVMHEGHGSLNEFGVVTESFNVQSDIRESFYTDTVNLLNFLISDCIQYIPTIYNRPISRLS